MLIGALQGSLAAVTKGWPYEVEMELPDKTIKFMVRAPSAAFTSDYLALASEKRSAEAAYVTFESRCFYLDDNGKEKPILTPSERNSFMKLPFFDYYVKAARFIHGKDAELQAQTHDKALEQALGN